MADRDVVREIWCDALGIPAVADEDDFLQIGGDSMAAVAIASRIRDGLGVVVPLQEIFEATSFAEFVERVDAIGAAGEPPPAAPPKLRRLDRDRPLLASLTQEHLWLLGEQPDQAAPMFVHVAFRIRGPLDQTRLSSALEVAGQAHEALRTGFHAEGGQLFQRVEPLSKVALQTVRIGAGEGLPAVQRLVRAEIARPFDREAPPLLRCTLFELAADDHIVLFVLDHFICDGVSLRVLVEDLARAYGELEHQPGYALPELPFQFADWAQWQRQLLSGPRLAELEAYWRARLGADPQVISTALPGYTVSTTDRAELLDVPVAPKIAAGLRAEARRRNLTLFGLLLNGFARCLAEETGRTELCVVTSLANREQYALERVFGPMAHDAYLRLDLDPGHSFDATVAEVRRATSELTEYGVIPNLLLWQRIWPDDEQRLHAALSGPAAYFSLNRPWFDGFRLAGTTIEPFPIDPLIPMPGLECWVADNEPDLRIGLAYLESNYSEDYLTGFAQRLIESIPIQD